MEITVPIRVLKKRVQIKYKMPRAGPRSGPALSFNLIAPRDVSWKSGQNAVDICMNFANIITQALRGLAFILLKPNHGTIA